MKVEVRTLQISKTSWAYDLCQSYIKKISHFAKAEFKPIKDDGRWLQNIQDQDYLIACDERGKSYTSRNFAQFMETLRDRGDKKIVFLIGGPFGLPDEVKKRCQSQICLSSLVMNQEVALTVLVEQIFRAFTIMNNHPYHND